MADQIIRSLFVQLGIKAEPEQVKAFDKALNEVKATQAALDTAFKATTVTVTAFTAAISIATQQTTALAEATVRQSAALGISNQRYQELVSTFERFGSDSKDVEDALVTLTDRVQELADGTQSYVDDFKLLGLTLKDFEGLNAADQFAVFADAVKNAGDNQERLAAVSRLLGDDLGLRLNPLLLQGSDGLERYAAAAREAGQVLDEEALAASNKLAFAQRNLRAELEGVRNQVGVAFTPAMLTATEALNRFLRANQSLIRARLDLLALRLDQAFTGVSEVFERLDRVIDRAGGWVVAFRRLEAAIGSALLFPVLVRGTQSVRALGAAMTTLSGVQLRALGVRLAALAPQLALATAAFGALYLVVDDFLTFLRGGESVLGSFLEEVGGGEALMEALEEALGTAGEAVEELGAELVALGAIFGELGATPENLFDFLKFLAGNEIEAATNNLRDFNDTLNTLLNLVRGVREAFQGGGFSELLGFVRENAGTIGGLAGRAGLRVSGLQGVAQTGESSFTGLSELREIWQSRLRTLQFEARQRREGRFVAPSFQPQNTFEGPQSVSEFQQQAALASTVTNTRATNITTGGLTINVTGTGLTQADIEQAGRTLLQEELRQTQAAFSGGGR